MGTFQIWRECKLSASIGLNAVMNRIPKFLIVVSLACAWVSHAGIALSAGEDSDARADRILTTAPDAPKHTGRNWAHFVGDMTVVGPLEDAQYPARFEWAYSMRRPPAKRPRVLVNLHGSGGGKASILQAYAPRSAADIEIRVQDAEAQNRKRREYWGWATTGEPLPGLRIVSALDFVRRLFPAMDIDTRGIVLHGTSMGGTGVFIQTMLLPEPWRARVAYVTAVIGIPLPRRANERDPGKFALWPKDRGPGSLWDRIDFSLSVQHDEIVRGMHYRHLFSSNDRTSQGPEGSTALEFVNLVEANRIAGAFFWIHNNHNAGEKGVRTGAIPGFEVKEQDVTLDRAHPAISDSTGNYPLTAQARMDMARYPRGHYNLGVVWDHARIEDRSDELVFPLKYMRHTEIGGGIPDQPESITISVTPRRAKAFRFKDGEQLQWSWNEGELSGTLVVRGDSATVTDIPLRDGDGYRRLRIYRNPR